MLYISQLGVNLLSKKRLCENGLQGNFDSNSMHYTRNNKTMIKAKIQNGLYIVDYIAKDYTETTLPETNQSVLIS